MNHLMYRRELLRRSALAAASIAILSCAPAATGPTASASLKPAKGGTITWGQWDKNDVIDPALTTGAAAGEIAQNILDTLITMDSDQKFYPALASKWTITDASKTFTFTLRDGVKFHDGSTLSSAAVKGSFDRILDPKTKAGAVVSLVGPIDKITTPDDRTVVFSFKQPYPAFMLQIWRYFFGVLSPKYLATLKPGDVAAEPVGSGPFMFAGRSSDGVVTIKANPDYSWGTELFKNRAAPYLDQI
ncbi:MAG TPA: ABC transporter substrate-binding protein, partial [Candidatus Limnocylindria bacterium]|nr:ABC transporter substrate-binding protein [Candidatus Limnocylindria bacterium]